jgi:hypothetical protein
MTIDGLVRKLRELLEEKRLKLLCAKCGDEWYGKHKCEGTK